LLPHERRFRGLLTNGSPDAVKQTGRGLRADLPVTHLVSAAHRARSCADQAQPRLVDRHHGCAAPITARPLATVDVPLDPAAS
jgi:hypothetical protein